MKKIQLKGNTPRTPRAKKVRPPKGTHRLYQKMTVPVIFTFGMSLAWGLAQLPRLAATASDRELLALMYAGSIGFVAFAGAMYFIGLGMKAVKNSPVGKMGGAKEFLAATAIFAAGAVAFVSLRNRADMAVLLWQTTITVGALLGVYTLFVRQAHPYTRDGVNLDDQEGGGVDQLAEKVGRYEDDADQYTEGPGPFGPTPEPEVATMPRPAGIYDWVTGQVLPRPDPAGVNGHG